MKKQNIFIMVSYLSFVMLLRTLLPAYAGPAPQTMQVEKIITSEQKEKDITSYFEEVCLIGADRYQLSGIETEIVEQRTVPGKFLEYWTPVFPKSENHEPEQTMLKDGEIYQLDQSELMEQTVKERTRYAEGTIFYNNVEWLDKIPDTGLVTVKDEQSGQKISERLPLINQVQTEDIWSDTFVFLIVVSDYDATAFMLNDTEIPKNAELKDYAEDFLDYLGLSSDYYRIQNISWDGEPYKAGGTVCRKAIATGQKLVHNVTAVYGGDVTIPSYQGYSYRCIYVDESKPDSTVYTIKATGTYTLEAFKLSGDGSFKVWPGDYLPMLIMSGIALAGIVILIMVLVLREKRKRQRVRNRIVEGCKTDKGEKV